MSTAMEYGSSPRVCRLLPATSPSSERRLRAAGTFRRVTQCTFCDIVASRTTADVVWEGPHAMAFLDHRPLFPGHVLVVPRSHVENLHVLDDDLLRPFFGAVRRLSQAVRAAVDAEGTFVAMNNEVSQSVPHLHVHVVPRRKGDGLRGFFWPRNPYEDDAHRERVRAAIAAAAED